MASMQHRWHASSTDSSCSAGRGTRTHRVLLERLQHMHMCTHTADIASHRSGQACSHAALGTDCLSWFEVLKAAPTGRPTTARRGRLRGYTYSRGEREALQAQSPEGGSQSVEAAVGGRGDSADHP
eukprot:229224-Chlamydomonas_euryale.AAC.3